MQLFLRFVIIIYILFRARRIAKGASTWSLITFALKAAQTVAITRVESSAFVVTPIATVTGMQSEFYISVLINESHILGALVQVTSLATVAATVAVWQWLKTMGT